MPRASRGSRSRLALLASLVGILILLLFPQAFRAGPFSPAGLVALVVLADLAAWRLERSRRAAAQRERALRESETRYRHLLEQASDGIVLAAPDGRLILANQRICELLGYREAELLQMPAASLFAQGESDETPLAWEELEGSSVVLRERELRRKDGSTLRAELSVRRSADGCAQAIVRDITERRRAEAAMRAEHAAVVEREEQLERITAAVPGVVYQFVVAADGTGRFAFVSERARQLFGVAAQEIMADSRRLRAVVDPDDYATMTASFRRAAQSREPWSYDFRVGTAPGQQLRWLRAIATASPGRDPGSVIWIGVVVNITEQKRLEEELRQSQKMDSLGRLAGGVAHDFNNLLTIIRGYADVLASELSPEDPRRAEVREIRGAADRATSLTRQLLAMSRRQVLVPREVDVNALVRDMERMLRRVIGEDIRIVTELAAELGWVRADPGQLEQVLLNLAVNARDAMPSGGTLTIATSGMLVAPDRDEPLARGVPPGEYVVLRVADTGVGMDRETLGKIFEPFFTTKPLGKGTGLGLSTVYGIVQQSSGAVTAASEPGSGSSFRVLLPRITRPVVPNHEPAAPRPLVRRARVLLVDDEENVRQLTARMLEQYGYEVSEARDGAEALARLAAGAAGVDALVSDVRMSGLSGTELVARLRAAHRELPVLLLSGYTGEDLDGAIGRDSACGFLQKPFSPEALVTALEELLADAKPPATAG